MMTGHASVNKAYSYANAAFGGGLVLCITRCKYATLAMMARNGGDLPVKGTAKLRSRLKTLAGWGLVRYVPGLKRYELTASGWNLIVDAEAALAIREEDAEARATALRSLDEVAAYEAK